MSYKEMEDPEYREIIFDIEHILRTNSGKNTPPEEAILDVPLYVSPLASIPGNLF